jgi:hypothetical protein
MAVLKKGKAKSVLQSGNLEKSKVKYRLVLLTKNGARADLKKATHFALFYGKKKLLSSAIPKARKTIPRKRDFLFTVVARIEKKRLQIIKSREFQRDRIRRRVRKAKREEGIKQIQRENLTFALDRYGDNFETQKLSIARANDQIAEETLDISQMREEEAVTLKESTLEYVLVTPFIPKNGDYIKEWIQKKISSESQSFILNLDIINFTLLKNLIPISNDSMTFQAAIIESVSRIWPHVKSAYEHLNDDPNKGWIFRLKYRRQTAKAGWIEQGISASRRQEFTDIGELHAEFLAAFEKFRGEKEPHSRELRTRNYFEGNQTLYISGFTLEASEREDYYAQPIPDKVRRKTNKRDGQRRTRNGR